MGVFVYADESGHSGKNIFDERAPVYYQGAIISLGDINDALDDVISRYCKELNVPRLHSNEHKEEIVAKICDNLLCCLKKIPWQFSLCTIFKPYISPTKFVDLFFDSFDNPAIPWLWYNSDLFRHTMCLVINQLMSEDEHIQFWEAFLHDNMPEMLQVAEKLLSRIHCIQDQRIKEVIGDGLQYAVKHPDEFTLICTNGKSAYKAQTPNMIAFSSLMSATHNFCKVHSDSVERLIHDRSDEFRGTMREYHRVFNRINQVENDYGGPVLFEEAEFNLGQFYLEKSENHSALQAVDVFLWMTQRELTTDFGYSVLQRLKEYICDFEISPRMSKFIVDMRSHQMRSVPLSPKDEREAKKLRNHLEAERKKKLMSK
ncbi:DUF3800 domain-containing protein [Morganella morganii]|uniref:DUF3800 domain-containing protein n=1 Tax=Morganella morganii TaxID=582 RepID=UPI003D08FC46